MMLPTSYDYSTGLATDTLSAHVAAPERARDRRRAELRLDACLDGNAWLGGNLFYRRDPGHIASSPDDIGAAIRFSLGF